VGEEVYTLYIGRERGFHEDATFAMGQCLAVRIPKHVASAAKWKAGDAIELEVEDSGAVKLQKRRRN